MKPTARARIEQAVKEISRKDALYQLTHGEAVNLILVERARLKRRVRKVLKECPHTVAEEKLLRAGWMEACNDILALWEG